MIEQNIGCLQTRESDDTQNAAGGQEVFFFSIGISSRNSRCLCFALLMNAQIDQIEKTQGAFIMYENVLFIRGKVKKLTEKRRKKWLVNLRLRSTGADQSVDLYLKLCLIIHVCFFKTVFMFYNGLNTTPAYHMS